MLSPLFFPLLCQTVTFLYNTYPNSVFPLLHSQLYAYHLPQIQLPVPGGQGPYVSCLWMVTTRCLTQTVSEIQMIRNMNNFNWPSIPLHLWSITEKFTCLYSSTSLTGLKKTQFSQRKEKIQPGVSQGRCRGINGNLITKPLRIFPASSGTDLSLVTHVFSSFLHIKVLLCCGQYPTENWRTLQRL